MMAAAKKPRRAQGEGGITQLDSGLYVATLERPRDPVTGKRRPLKLTSMDKAALMKKRTAALVKLSQNGDVATDSDTMSKYMAYWIDNVNQSRPRTKAGYRTCIRYIDRAIGKIKLTQLTPADCRKLEALIVKSLGLSPTTALQAYQVLAKALKDAEREGRVMRNVARLIDPPRKAATALTVLTTDEGIAVIGSVADERLGSRWAAALLTGARQGELLGLELDRVVLDGDYPHIDLSWQLQRINWRHGANCTLDGKHDDGTPKRKCGFKMGTRCPTRTIDAPADWEHRVIEGGLYWSRPKSKAGWRIIPLVEPLRSIMELRIAAAKHEPNPHGLVWTSDQKHARGRSDIVYPLDGSPVDPSRDNAAWHVVLHHAGVPQVRLHDARHTAVTILYDLGVSETVIQDIVGQSTVATTRSYRHKNKKPMYEAMSLLGLALTEKLALTATAAELDTKIVEAIESLEAREAIEAA